MTRSSSTEPAGPAEFDVRAFARTAHGSLRDDLDLDAVTAAPLPPDVVAALGALAVLEGATMAHLRNVLVTNTHKDARVTAFLVTWAFEKFWIADALRAIVDASAGSDADRAGGQRAAPTRTAAPGGAASGGRGPVRRAFAGITQGWAVVGAHMTARPRRRPGAGGGLREGGRIVHERGPRRGGRADRRGEGPAHAVLRRGGRSGG